MAALMKRWSAGDEAVCFLEAAVLVTRVLRQVPDCLPASR